MTGEAAAPGARWEHFPHAADVGLRGFGADVAQAFEQTALALTAAVTDPASVRADQRVILECTAPDRELLLAEWLNALIYEMAVRRMLFSRFAVTIDGSRLTGQAWGEAVDRVRHRPAAEPKGATFTALKVAELPAGGWLAQCVVDV
ncbi:MAG: archease [Kiloniellaceae bacterium]